jgi:hypothetical protein
VQYTAYSLNPEMDSNHLFVRGFIVSLFFVRCFSFVVHCRDAINRVSTTNNEPRTKNNEPRTTNHERKTKNERKKKSIPIPIRKRYQRQHYRDFN